MGKTNREKIKSFRKLKENWDSYGALPIHKKAIDIALRIEMLLDTEWFVAPMSSGGILFEKNEEDFIEVHSLAD